VERVILSTGGTGGHIFPALAVAAEMKTRFPGIRILFVGGSRGRDREFAEKAGLEFLGLPVRGVMGSGAKALGAVFWLSRSILKSWMLMRKYRPDAVVGFGGYAGFAPVLAACIRGVPRAVHEQNSLPGFANRVLARWSNRVFLSFPDENRLFDEKRTIVTGCPARREITALWDKFTEPPEEGLTKRLLVMGGSQGARALNEAVVKALPAMRERNIEIRHQTGRADLERVRSGYKERGMDSIRVEAFIEDMSEAYAWADLVLCRAGAATVAELSVAGKPSILVPYPHATHRHQSQNARFLEDAGAAMILMQNFLGEIDLARTVDEIFLTPGRIRSMAGAAHRLGRPDAAKRLVREVEVMAA